MMLHGRPPSSDAWGWCTVRPRTSILSGDDHPEAQLICAGPITSSLNPASALALYLLGMSHLYDGRANEGLPHIESAIRLSPHDQYAGRFMAAIAEGNLFLGEYEKALEWAEDNRELDQSAKVSLSIP